MIVKGFPWRMTLCVRGRDHLRSDAGELVYENRYVIWGHLRWFRLKRYEVYEDTQKTVVFDRWLVDNQHAAARGLMATVRSRRRCRCARRRPVAARRRANRGRAARCACDLRDVTLCFNDWGGAQVMIADGLVTGRAPGLIACEAFENYPPGLPGRLASLSARMPGGIEMMRRALLVRRLRELPITFGRMSKHGVPDELMRDWLAPLARREIRRDLAKYAGDAWRGRRDMLAATPSLSTFERPVLVVWARRTG